MLEFDEVIAVRCDASTTTGAGHVMRCLALAEGLLEVGLGVVFLGSLGGVATAERHVRRAGITRVDAPADLSGLLKQLRALRARALVVDSYAVPAPTYAGVRAAGLPLVAVVDGPTADVDADLVVAPGPGAQDGRNLHHARAVLCGPRFALLRSAVTVHRPGVPSVRDEVSRILVVLGGTDVHRSAPLVAQLVLATGAGVHVDVVCADDELGARVRGLRTLPGQTVTAHPLLQDLAATAAKADLVVTAAGTTTTELACLGRPMALIVVADNQIAGCEALVGAGAAVGLGRAEGLWEDRAGVTSALTSVMRDHGRRVALATTAHAMVDGRGRDRVAAAVRGLVSDTLT